MDWAGPNRPGTGPARYCAGPDRTGPGWPVPGF
ncbi:unnamed protein product [Cuscuta epithymum]|uniref:Uncharacterized protein n=1 Tax=Cuscuta epithymum TaxID=186058 RepID=A0AAV0EZ94_9ASTE|nr:unnamed protein product [Cuscuta epithymum]